MDSYHKKMKSFFVKKQKYEKKKATAIRKIMANDDYTLAEKREQVKDLKIACIQCKRKVNTIFGIENNTYTAKCGSVDSPCKLNISIKRKTIQQLKDVIDDLKESLATVKTDITKIKLNYLFKYTDEETTVKIFEEQRELMISLNEALTALEEDYKTRLNELERQSLLKDNQLKMHRLVDAIKSNHQQYLLTQEPQYLKDNATFVKDEVLPLQDEIRKIKYDINLVELEGEDLYKLYQVKHADMKTEKEIVA